jgi:hypothetical protein
MSHVLKSSLKKYSLLLLLVVVFSVGVFGIFQYTRNKSTQSQAATSDIFVAPNGNDTNGNGSIGNPFLTLEKARDTARTLTSAMTSDVVINLRGGEYPRTSTFELNEQDSGKNGHNVVYQSYNNEPAVITGGKKVTTAWSLFDNTKNIYRTQVGSLNVLPRTLIVNDQIAPRARSENNPAWLTRTNQKINFTNAHSYFTTTPNNLEIELGYTVNFVQGRCQPTSVTSNEFILEPNCTIPMQGAYGPNGFIYGVEQIRWVENAYELLDDQNEWYYNKTDQYLYYKPVGTNDPNTLDIRIPQIEKLVNIKGKIEDSAKNIHIKNISFKHGEWDLFGISRIHIATPKSYSPEYNLFYKRLSLHQIEARYAESLLFEGNTITATGGGGIWIDAVRNSKIYHNTLTNLGAQGITIGDIKQKRFPSSPTISTINNTIYNNLIDNFGLQNPDAIGISNHSATNTIISHNDISNGGYQGINIGEGLQVNTYSQAFNTKVIYNKIHDVMKVLRDGGSIYSSSTDPNALIEYNYIYNPSLNNDTMVYFDDGSAFKTLRKNVIKNGSTKWLQSWNGSQTNNFFQDNYVTNNVNTNFITPETNNVYQNNQVFVNDNDFAEIPQIITASGICSIKNNNINQCDISNTYCPNGEINPGSCNNQPPVGSFEKVESNVAYAWAKDPNSSSPIQVKAFVGSMTQPQPTYQSNIFGGVYPLQLVRSIGTFTCNQSRNDSNTGYGCQIPIPSQYTSNDYSVFLFAIDSSQINKTTYLPLYNTTFQINRSNILKPFVCSPSFFLINTTGQTATCTLELPPTQGTYTIPPVVFSSIYNTNTGGLYAAVKQNNNFPEDYLVYGNSDLCTVAGNTVTCTNLPVGNISAPGQKEIIGVRVFEEYLYSGGVINYVNTLPISFTPSQLDSALSCATNPPLVVNTQSSVVCSGTLPPDTFTSTLTVKISANGNPVSCAISGVNITCPAITITPTSAGQFPVLASTTGATNLSNIPIETLNVTAAPTCTNGATDYPACTTCPSDQTLQNGQCAAIQQTCTNGATDYPACTTCPSDQTLQNGQCAAIQQTCTNGATDYPACTTCPSDQTLQIGLCKPPNNTKTQLTEIEIINTTFSCNDSKDVLVGVNVSCKFSLPSDKLVPDNFSLAIGNGKQGLSKVSYNIRSQNTMPFTIEVNAQTGQSTITVSQVPTGTQTGQVPIYAQFAGTGLINTGETIIVSSLTLSDIPTTSALPRTGGMENMLIILAISTYMLAILFCIKVLV